MIKKIIIISITMLIILYAQTNQSPIELLQQVGEDILGAFVKPLVSSFGAALNTGLYHSAQVHDMFGFDLQLKVMYIPIPEIGKTYNYRVPGLTINPNTLQLDTVWFTGTANTVFGDESQTTVFQDQGNTGTDTIAIPPILPGGINLPFVPFAVPQLSFSVYQGTELLVRYFPTVKIPEIEEKLSFRGIGLKQEINQLPLAFVNNLPVSIALQGVYQSLNIGDIVRSSALNFNVHASKKFSVITPYLGVGWEDAKLTFKYDFIYDKPDPNTPGQVVSDTISINKEIPADNKIRLVVGTTLNLGPLLLNVAYNLSKYSVIKAGLGISIK